MNLRKRLLLMKGSDKWWNVVSSSNARYAGIISTSFADDTEVNGSTGGLTLISGVVTERCRQHGNIRSVKARIYRISGASKRIKFKVFRPNGANYDYVGQSEYITPAGTGTITYTLSNPIPCQPGDILGLWIEGDDVPRVALSVVSKAATADSIRYTTGDIVTTDAFASTVSNYSLCLDGYGKPPALVVTGDSIPAGHADWDTFYDSGPAGTLTKEPWYMLRQLYAPALEYQNHSKDAQTFAWVLSTGIVSAIATGPIKLLIHCGVNDVDTGRTWANVLSDLDAIRALVPTTIDLYIDEILPWTNGSDANAITIRTWNTNLAAWCAVNNAKLIVCHDAMGQIRVATGELDDLLTAYDEDGVHLTDAGNANWMALVKAQL